jgi:hypothetical protein
VAALAVGGPDLSGAFVEVDRLVDGGGDRCVEVVAGARDGVDGAGKDAGNIYKKWLKLAYCFGIFGFCVWLFLSF